jgi:DNA-binding transcriptional MerR regulator
MILILRGKQLGFSLSDIKEFLDLYEVDRTQTVQIKLLAKKVRQRIEQLEDQRQALELSLSELQAIEREALNALRHKAETGAA